MREPTSQSYGRGGQIARMMKEASGRPGAETIQRSIIDLNVRNLYFDQVPPYGFQKHEILDLGLGVLIHGHEAMAFTYSKSGGVSVYGLSGGAVSGEAYVFQPDPYGSRGSADFNLGTATNRWSNLYANDVFAGEIREAALGDGTSHVHQLLLQHAVQFQSDVTPAQITADQNDYDISGTGSGAASYTVARLSSDASRNITGLSGGTDGQMLLLFNVGSNNIVLKDESASSTAANRFALNGDITLETDEGAGLWYDSTSSRWRPFAEYTEAPSAGAPTDAEYVVTAANGTLSAEKVVSAPATGGTIPAAAEKDADESVASDNTLSNDDDLHFEADANTTYEVEVTTLLTSTDLGDGGFQCAFSVPTGATGVHSGVLIRDVGAMQADHDTTITTALTFPATASAAANAIVIVRARIEISSTAGTVTFQHAQATSHATAYVLKKGSDIVAFEV